MLSRPPSWGKLRIAGGILLAAGASVATSNVGSSSRGSAATTLENRTFPGLTEGVVRVQFDGDALQATDWAASLGASVGCASGDSLPASVTLDGTTTEGDLCHTVFTSVRPRLESSRCLQGRPFCTVDLEYSVFVGVSHPPANLRIEAFVDVTTDDKDGAGKVAVSFH